MDDEACLYYKLTNEPKSSGELISYSNAISSFKNLFGLRAF